MDIKEILSLEPESAISELKKKTINVPGWGALEREYNPKKHEVYTDPTYKDIVKSDSIVKVTRISLSWQKLAVRRMAGLMFSVPVSRIYHPKDDNEKKAQEIIESIYKKNRIDSVNKERSKKVFASCECVTIWYAQKQDTEYGGEVSPLKLRCKNFSPMDGDELYPLFDEYDDMIALSVQYKRTENECQVIYFDTYTSDAHIRWVNRNEGWKVEIQEKTTVGKITGLYIHRKTPIWEDQSDNITELEWTLSRNGNYLRKNSRPNWVVYSDDPLITGGENSNNNQSRNVLHYSKDSKAEYVTWNQAVESLKFHRDSIKENFFMELQLPDMSWNNMKTTPMSGESRKMMFLDAQMKCEDESGAWLEMLDRELNVIRSFASIMYPKYADAILNVDIENRITPFNISVKSEQINNLVQATGGKPIMSQRTAIQEFGMVDDIDSEIEEMKKEGESSIFSEPTI